MTAGRGATEVHWMLRPGAGSVLHFQPAARGLLSLISLVRAFLLNVIKRNQAQRLQKTPVLLALKKRHVTHVPSFTFFRRTVVRRFARKGHLVTSSHLVTFSLDYA